jgi:hypothetical protein
MPMTPLRANASCKKPLVRMSSMKALTAASASLLSFPTMMVGSDHV